MRRSRIYALVFGGVVFAILASIFLSSPGSMPVVAQYYVVGGELEVPQISKGSDYTTLLIVGGVAAASILIGLYVASRMRSSSE